MRCVVALGKISLLASRFTPTTVYAYVPPLNSTQKFLLTAYVAPLDKSRDFQRIVTANLRKWERLRDISWVIRTTIS